MSALQLCAELDDEIRERERIEMTKYDKEEGYLIMVKGHRRLEIKGFTMETFKHIEFLFMKSTDSQAIKVATLIEKMLEDENYGTQEREDAMHEELHKEMLNRFYLNGYEYIFDEDRQEARDGILREECEFCP